MYKYLLNNNQNDQRSTISSSYPSASSPSSPNSPISFPAALPSPTKPISIWNYFTRHSSSSPAQPSPKPLQKTSSPTRPSPTPRSWFPTKRVHPIVTPPPVSSSPQPSSTPAASAITASPPFTVALSELTQDSHALRNKILLDIPLEFLTNTILILYGPPRSSLGEEIALYLAQKFQYVILNPADYHPFTPHSPSLSNPPHHPAPNSTDPSPKSTDPSKCSVSYNSTTTTTAAAGGTTAAAADDRRESFRSRIQEKDCAKGFIFLNFPQSVVDFNFLQDLTPNYRKVVLVIDQDFTVTPPPPPSSPVLTNPSSSPLPSPLPNSTLPCNSETCSIKMRRLDSSSFRSKISHFHFTTKVYDLWDT